MRFHGRVSLYIMIVVDFIDGVCFTDFKDMSDEERTACKESIDQLHENMVVHGDINPENFIVRYSAIRNCNSKFHKHFQLLLRNISGII